MMDRRITKWVTEEEKSNVNNTMFPAYFLFQAAEQQYQLERKSSAGSER